ncbi:hypothetical protein NSQ54_18190 [Alkalihalobacillus sp. FSL W8-0930]
MKKKIAVGATLLITLICAVVIYLGLTQNSILSKETPDSETTRELGTATEESNGIIEYEPSTERIVFQEGEEERVREILKEQHDNLNTLAGWGAVERIDHNSLADKDKWRQLKADVEWLSQHGLAPSEAINDLKNAKVLMELSEEHEDEMSVRYLHRIFHDLDAHVNETKVDKLWGVTYAFGSEEEIDKVYSYISDFK